MKASQEAPVFVAPADFTAAVAAASTSAAQWRVTADEHPYQTAAQTILGHLDTDLPLARFAGPGHWNDLDMLVPGPVGAHHFGWTVQQEQSQLAVWSMEASPLILSTNVPRLTPAELAPLKNPDMIAVDQSGAQASRGGLTGYVRYLFKPADGGVAVLLANTGTSAAKVALPLDRVGIRSATAQVHDVFGGSWTARQPAGRTRPWPGPAVRPQGGRAGRGATFAANVATMPKPRQPPPGKRLPGLGGPHARIFPYFPPQKYPRPGHAGIWQALHPQRAIAPFHLFGPYPDPRRAGHDAKPSLAPGRALPRGENHDAKLELPLRPAAPRLRGSNRRLVQACSVLLVPRPAFALFRRYGYAWAGA